MRCYVGVDVSVCVQVFGRADDLLDDIDGLRYGNIDVLVAWEWYERDMRNYEIIKTARDISPFDEQNS